MDKLAEEEEDPKKYFDPKKYATKIVSVNDIDEADNDQNKSKPQSKEEAAELEIETIIALLTDPKHKAYKNETLSSLKKDRKEDFLLLAIAKNQNSNIQHLLVAACWEAEIDFSKYLPFFVKLVFDENYLVCIEAITVISTMEGPFDKNHVSTAIADVKNAKDLALDEKEVLYNDLLETLKTFSIS